jgi:hypothetical protein
MNIINGLMEQPKVFSSLGQTPKQNVESNCTEPDLIKISILIYSLVMIEILRDTNKHLWMKNACFDGVLSVA